MSKLTTFDISQYLDSKEMTAEYLSQVLKDSDMNELLESIGNIAKYKKRTIDIAKSIYKVKKDEPKIWFTSIKSMAQVLSNDNQDLLQRIDSWH